MADADRAPDEGWLVLIYRVPSEPSRLRSAVWRRLKSLGAIYLQNSAAALPASVGNERALRKLRSQILDMTGTAALLSCRVLAGEQEVRATFQAARNDEYEEIVDHCEDFLGQVKKEYVANHFTYAELEENEVDLVKLRTWFARVRAAGRVRRDRPPRSGEGPRDLPAVAGRLRGPGLRGRRRRPLTVLGGTCWPLSTSCPAHPGRRTYPPAFLHTRRPHPGATNKPNLCQILEVTAVRSVLYCTLNVQAISRTFRVRTASAICRS